MALLDTATGQQSKARSSSFALPAAIQRLLEAGLELGDADDQVLNVVTLCRAFICVPIPLMRVHVSQLQSARTEDILYL